MEKVVKFIKKYLILIIIVLIVLVFAYSHMTSTRVTKYISDSLQTSKLMTITFEETDEYLKGLGYEVKVEKNEDDGSLDLYALKGKEIIEISYLEGIADYEFINTDKNVVPMIYDVDWNDSKSTIKGKLGINILNTRFTSLKGSFGTSITVADLGNDDCIIIQANEYSDYSYDFSFDENNVLNKINVIRYNMEK